MLKKTEKKSTAVFEAVSLRTDDLNGTVSVGTALPHFSWKMKHCPSNDRDLPKGHSSQLGGTLCPNLVCEYQNNHGYE